MLVTEPNLSTGLSAAAVLIATIAASIAYASYRLARKSYAIAKTTSDLSKPNSRLYLIDAFRYRPRDRDKTLFVFCVSTENKSTIQNSIVEVELRVPFVRDGLERLAVFTHSNTFSHSNNTIIKNTIQLPAVLPARGALIANYCFDIPNEMLERAEFDLHILRFKYAEGPFDELQPKVIMDLINVQDLEKKRNSGVPI